MTTNPETSIVQTYLGLLDAQREETYAALDNLSPDQLWQRPAPKEWCIGEILNHNVLLFRSVFPIVRFTWHTFRWMGKLLRNRTYKTTIEDPYRNDNVPMWVGFLWTPKHTPDNPTSLEHLYKEQCEEHAKVRAFYTGKDEDVLGNVFLFDPLFGFINLIITLRVGIYHDQLHYDDVITLAKKFKTSTQNETSQPL